LKILDFFALRLASALVLQGHEHFTEA
jgi:hypothetical protein